MARAGRRRFLAGAGALAAARLVRAQQRKPVLGLLYPNPSSGPQGTAQAYFTGILKKLGWTVDTDVVLQHASGEGSEDRLQELANELVAKRVDVIWAAGPEAALAAARATRSIPIAFYGVAYPVEAELVESLARPGRNVTGLASVAGVGYVKALELLREIVPGTKRVAWLAVDTVIWSVSGKEVRLSYQAILESARGLGFEIERFPVSRREDFDDAFKAILDSRPQALLSDFTALTFRERNRIAGFALSQRLPAVATPSVFAEAGFLASYGPNRGWMIEYSFRYVDRILRGAKPAELAVELPSRYEMTLNLKTAKALGITIPSAVLVRADRVIE